MKIVAALFLYVGLRLVRVAFALRGPVVGPSMLGKWLAVSGSVQGGRR